MEARLPFGQNSTKSINSDSNSGPGDYQFLRVPETNPEILTITDSSVDDELSQLEEEPDVLPVYTKHLPKVGQNEQYVLPSKTVDNPLPQMGSAIIQWGDDVSSPPVSSESDMDDPISPSMDALPDMGRWMGSKASVSDDSMNQSSFDSDIDEHPFEGKEWCGYQPFPVDNNRSSTDDEIQPSRPVDLRFHTQNENFDTILEEGSGDDSDGSLGKDENETTLRIDMSESHATQLSPYPAHRQKIDLDPEDEAWSLSSDEENLVDPQNVHLTLNQKQQETLPDSPTLRWILWLMIALCFLIIILQVLVLSLETWSEMKFVTTAPEPSEQTWTFGLLTCTDWNDANDGKNIDCLKLEHCLEDGPLCNMFTDFRKAGFVYFSCACITLFLTVLVIEKWLVQVLRSGNGDNYWSIAWVCLLFVTQTIGTAVWFALAPASYDDECEIDNNDTDHAHFCVLEGPNIVIAIWILTLIVANLGIIIFPTMQQIPSIQLDRKVFCLGQRGYFVITLFLLCLNILFMIISLSSVNWIHREEEPTFEGSLFSFAEWGKQDRYGYSWVEANACNYDSDLGSWALAEDLDLAGKYYVYFEIIALGCIGMWFQGVFLSSVNSIQYGNLYINLIWALGTLLFHSAALGTWVEISEVKFEAESEEAQSPDEKVKIYPMNAPIISIIAIVTIILSILVYILPNMKSQQKRDKTDFTRINESLAPSMVATPSASPSGSFYLDKETPTANNWKRGKY